MDIGLLKSSSSEDQMAEMMLLMQMEKINPHHHHHELVAGGAGGPNNHHHVSATPGLMSTGYSPTDSRGSRGSSNLNPTISQDLYSHDRTDGTSTIFLTNNINTGPDHSPSIPQNNSPSTGDGGHWRSNHGGDEFLGGGRGRGGGGGGRNSPPSTTNTKQNSMAAMREMIFRIAAMQPIYIDPESVKPPKRRNVRISTDPQSVAARHRRERISEKIRILQRLVPGGTKMDTASMLDEAIHYVKFLKTQVQSLEQAAVNRPPMTGVDPTAAGIGFPVPVSAAGEVSYFPSMKGYPIQQQQMQSADQQL